MTLEIVILAAGQGSRMKSQTPKVLHPVGGKPMLAHVVDSALELNPTRIHVVVGKGAEQVQAYFAGRADIQFVEQAEQNGTGHAVMQALPKIASDAMVLILYGDVPLVPVGVLQQMSTVEQGLSLLTVNLDDPTGYGRIQRTAGGAVVGIVEQKEANAEQLAIQEINTGIMALPAQRLQQWLPQLSNKNAQGEYYLTDIIALAAEGAVVITTFQPEHLYQVEGVNNRLQLASLERSYQAAQAERLMLAGVSLADPARIDVRGQATVGSDTEIDINVVLQGEVNIGQRVRIGPNCVLQDCRIDDDVEIKANSVIENASVASHCVVGPFARLRPGTELAQGAKIGNFVETKKAQIGPGSKVNHLSYVGDAQIGAGVNIGAGTITCNYDGVNKHLTELGDGVFVGSNTALVAPVSVAEQATIGAGSTITGDVQAQQLAVARAKQRNINNWKKPSKP